MKKFIIVAIVACLGFLVSQSFAQAPTTQAGSKSASKTTTYVCPKCHATSSAAGKCKKCNVAMVKSGTYYCAGCGATSDKAGKCAKCNKDMVMVTASK